MKETLAYDLLTVMQEKKQKRLTAKWRQWEFSVQYYDYEWVHKRVCDLVTNWCAMRAWATDDWILLYKVSEKWLCIKSFDDYKKATYKPRTPKPKKTREESAVKKECKKENKAWSFMPDGKNKLIWWDVFKKECKMPCMLLATACDTCKEAFKGLLPPKQPRYKRLRSAFTGK